jgi:hypothetical protein
MNPLARQADFSDRSHPDITLKHKPSAVKLDPLP